MTTQQIIRRIEDDTRLLNDASFSDDCRNAAAFRADKNTDALVRLAEQGDAEAEAYLDAQSKLAHEAEEAEAQAEARSAAIEFVTEAVNDATALYGAGPRMRRIRARVQESALALLESRGNRLSVPTRAAVRNHLREALFQASFDL